MLEMVLVTGGVQKNQNRWCWNQNQNHRFQKELNRKNQWFSFDFYLVKL